MMEFWVLAVLSSGVLGYCLGRYFSLSSSLDRVLHKEACESVDRQKAWQAFEQSGARELFEDSIGRKWDV